jgi:hypothetical protein
VCVCNLAFIPSKTPELGAINRVGAAKKVRCEDKQADRTLRGRAGEQETTSSCLPPRPGMKAWVECQERLGNSLGRQGSSGQRDCHVTPPRIPETLLGNRVHVSLVSLNFLRSNHHSALYSYKFDDSRFHMCMRENSALLPLAYFASA